MFKISTAIARERNAAVQNMTPTMAIGVFFQETSKDWVSARAAFMEVAAWSAGFSFWWRRDTRQTPNACDDGGV
jgi:hypothetical protein